MINSEQTVRFNFGMRFRDAISGQIAFFKKESPLHEGQMSIGANYYIRGQEKCNNQFTWALMGPTPLGAVGSDL